MPVMKIKKGDSVVITAGRVAAETPRTRQSPRRVIQVLDGGNLVVVEGVNLVYKHVRRGHPKSPQGGRLRMEMPIHGSKVMYYCDKCQQGVRLGLRYNSEGAKERFCRKCGTAVGEVSPAKKRYAR
jgi:large subunit ribosomal protein L24